MFCPLLGHYQVSVSVKVLNLYAVWIRHLMMTQLESKHVIPLTFVALM
jgi:hypothetical protein